MGIETEKEDLIDLIDFGFEDLAAEYEDSGSNEDVKDFIIKKINELTESNVEVIEEKEEDTGHDDDDGLLRLLLKLKEKDLFISLNIYYSLVGHEWEIDFDVYSTEDFTRLKEKLIKVLNKNTESTLAKILTGNTHSLLKKLKV